MITRVTYQSQVSGHEYEFVIELDRHFPDGSLVATCIRPDGGLNTSARTMSELLFVMIPDCVVTWEEV